MVEGSVQQLVHALAPRQGPAALHARRDDRAARASGCTSSASATRELQLLRAGDRRAAGRSTRRTSGSSRAATSTTRRSGSSTPRRRWRRSRCIGAGMLADREVIPQALKLNPAFFETIYTDLLNAQKTRPSVEAALEAVDATWPTRAPTLFAPVLDYLREAGEARSCTEIEDHFKRHFDVERRDDGVRVPGRPGADRQGVDCRRGSPRRATSTCRSWRSSAWATADARLSRREDERTPR